MGARALFRGPQHVCVAVNEEFARGIAGDAVGVPARERFTDGESARSQILMDATFSDGIPRTMNVLTTDGIAGLVMIVPVIRCGRVWGLVTEFQPSYVRQPTPASPAPSLTAGAGRAAQPTR